MKIKKILVSQPQPESEKSPYYELAEKNNVKIELTLTKAQISDFGSRNFSSEE